LATVNSSIGIYVVNSAIGSRTAFNNIKIPSGPCIKLDTQTTFNYVANNAVYSASTYKYFTNGEGYTEFKGNEYNGPTLKSVTAATTLNVSNQSSLDIIKIVGNTEISAFLDINKFPGKVLTLYFTGTPKLKHATSNLYFMGTADLTMASGRQLKFVWDGSTFWVCDDL
jgi:hypothetical protein